MDRQPVGQTENRGHVRLCMDTFGCGTGVLLQYWHTTTKSPRTRMNFIHHKIIYLLLIEIKVAVFNRTDV